MPKRRNPPKSNPPRGSPSRVSPGKHSTGRQRHDSADENNPISQEGLPGSGPPSRSIRRFFTFATLLAFAKRGNRQRDVETQMKDGSGGSSRKGSRKSTGERSSSSGPSSVPTAIPGPSSAVNPRLPAIDGCTVAFRGGSKPPDVSIQMPGTSSSSSGSSGGERRKNDKVDVNFSDSSSSSSSGGENSPKSSPTWRKRMKMQIAERAKKIKAAMEKELSSTDKDDSSGWEDVPERSPTKMRKLFIKQLNKRTVKTKASNRKLFRRLVKKATLTLIEKTTDDDHARSSIVRIKKASPKPVGLVDCSLFFYLKDLSVVGLCRSFGQKRPKCLMVLNLVCFIVFHTIAFINLWCGLKASTLYFLGNAHRTDNLLDVVQTFCYGILIIIFFYFLTFGWEKVTDVLRQMRFKMYWKLGMINRNKRHLLIARFLLVKSVCTSVLLSVYGIYAPRGWSIEQLNRVYNYQMHEDLYIWNIATYHNDSMLLLRTFLRGDDPDLFTGFTVIRFVLSFCGRLQELMLDDFMLLMAISLLEHTLDFIKIMLDPRFSLARTWEAYEDLKTIIEQVNDTFKILVPFYHIRSFLVVPRCFIGAWQKTKHFGIWGSGLRVINVIIIYSIGFFTSQKGKEISKWIKGLCQKRSVIIYNGVRLTVQFMLDCSNNDKIGLGLDEFFVSQSFIIWFIGIVISIFLFLVDKYDADKKQS